MSVRVGIGLFQRQSRIENKDISIPARSIQAGVLLCRTIRCDITFWGKQISKLCCYCRHFKRLAMPGINGFDIHLFQSGIGIFQII